MQNRSLVLLLGLACAAGVPLAGQPVPCMAGTPALAAVQGLMEIAPDSALRAAKQLEKRFEAEGAAAGLACTRQLIALLCYRLSNFPQALAYQLDAHSLWTQQGEPDLLAASFNQLGWIYYASGRAALARQSFQQAHAQYEALGDRGGVAAALGNLGHMLEKEARYDEAEGYQLEALAMYRQLGDSGGVARIYTHLGSIAEDEQRFDDAMQYFRLAQAYYSRQGALRELLDVYNNLGDVYQKTGRYAESLEFTRQALRLAALLQDKPKLTSSYRDLGETYALLGMPAAAYACLDSAWKLYHEVYPDESARQLAAMQALYETERMSAEIGRLQQQERANLLLAAGALLGLVLLATIALLIFRQQRWSIRNGQLIAERNRQIFAQEQALLRAEIENRRLNELRLGEELAAKSSSLSAHTLHTIRKNQVLDQIRSRLQATLKARSREYRQVIQDTLRLTEAHLDQEREWEDFRKMFEQVHQAFFDVLAQRFPDLSPAEIKLCALIRLRMESRDMAAFLGISPDSLRIARYRLKRKLGLGPDTSLTEFVQTLAAGTGPEGA
ncbi:MAG: tetratricopeptide repeat protein [Bacteroidia bacterium]|nr:tetratricopeptide repeat protein [Bacteroidia bacterium]